MSSILEREVHAGHTARRGREAEAGRQHEEAARQFVIIRQPEPETCSDNVLVHVLVIFSMRDTQVILYMRCGVR